LRLYVQGIRNGWTSLMNSGGDWPPSGTNTARRTRASGPGVERLDSSGNETLPHARSMLIVQVRVRAKQFHRRLRLASDVEPVTANIRRDRNEQRGADRKTCIRPGRGVSPLSFPKRSEKRHAAEQIALTDQDDRQHRPRKSLPDLIGATRKRVR
jgi:hypothetical protein